MPKDINLLKGKYTGQKCALIGRGHSCRPTLAFKPGVCVITVNSRIPHRAANYNFYMDKAYEEYANPSHVQCAPAEIRSFAADYIFDGGRYLSSGSAALHIASDLMGFSDIFLYGFECTNVHGVTHGDTGDYVADYDFENMVKSFHMFQYNANIWNMSEHSVLRFDKLDKNDKRHIDILLDIP